MKTEHKKKCFPSNYFTVEEIAKRKNVVDGMRIKNPTSVPICVVPDRNSFPDEKKNRKLLFPSVCTVIDLTSIIRKKLSLTPEKAIFLFIDGTTIPKATDLLSSIYMQHRCEDDGILYVFVNAENTFG
jgi:GABA(A) receptor-associated protein